MRVINKSFLSANQQYKLSGSTLPFKDWLNREKQKGEVIPKSGVSDVLEDALLLEDYSSAGVDPIKEPKSIEYKINNEATRYLESYLKIIANSKKELRKIAIINS